MTERLFCECPADAFSPLAPTSRANRCTRCGKPRPQPDALPLPFPMTPSPRRTPLRAPPEQDAPQSLEASPVVEVGQFPPRPGPNRPSSEGQDGRRARAGLAQRVTQNRLEQQRICLFLGLAIAGWSLFSLLPGALAWQAWLGSDAAQPLPRWLAIQLVYGATPGLLGLLLIQVPHWTTLQAIAVGLLVWACGYAFAATLLGLPSSETIWLGWLQLPFVQTARATLWCLAMLVIAAILSLACFREGQRWRRIEQLFSELKLSGDD